MTWMLFARAPSSIGSYIFHTALVLLYSPAASQWPQTFSEALPLCLCKFFFVLAPLNPPVSGLHIQAQVFLNISLFSSSLHCVQGMSGHSGTVC